MTIAPAIRISASMGKSPLLAFLPVGVLAARAALPLGPPNARGGGWQVISQGAWDHLRELI